VPPKCKLDDRQWKVFVSYLAGDLALDGGKFYDLVYAMFAYAELRDHSQETTKTIIDFYHKLRDHMNQTFEPCHFGLVTIAFVRVIVWLHLHTLKEMRALRAHEYVQALCSCGQSGTKSCGRCRSKRYCSIECQKQDWAAHKLLCSSTPLEDPPGAATASSTPFTDYSLRHPCACCADH